MDSFDSSTISFGIFSASMVMPLNGAGVGAGAGPGAGSIVVIELVVLALVAATVI